MPLVALEARPLTAMRPRVYEIMAEFRAFGTTTQQDEVPGAVQWSLMGSRVLGPERAPWLYW